MNANLVPIDAEPTSLAQVSDICTQVEVWAETCDDLSALRDNTNKLAAINEYLVRTSKDGQARVQAAMRRLEMRMHELRPETKQGERTDLELRDRDHEVPDIGRKAWSAFREMAENREVVEQVIEQSTDESPPSRRKVLAAIKAKNTPERKYAGQNKTKAAVAWRREQVAELADRGWFSTQIAEHLDISDGTVVSIAKELGVDIRANRLMQRRRARLDLDEYIVTMAEGLASSIDRAMDMIDGDWDDLDPTARTRAAAVLNEAQPRLRRLARALGGQPPAVRNDGIGAARWVTVEEDTWRDFIIATATAGVRPGAVLGQAVEDYLKQENP